MSQGYAIPAAEHRVEIRVLNSRFIATGAATPSVDDARAFIARIRSEFADATHNVHAYVIGHGASVTLGATDDGEPAGTAGRPVLAVLQGSGLGDATVVVTRYFGGTLLGTGGLVRAYGDAARALLNELPRTMRIETRDALLSTPYPFYERLRQLAHEVHAELLSEEFGADVTLALRLPADQLDAFTAQVRDLTAGQVELLCI